MIKLHSRHCLVTAADGHLHSLDVDTVRRDLQESFQACGMREAWSADHIALVIEEHASSRTVPDQAPLAEADLHAMVCTLLSASGYEDVGREYRRRVPAAAVPSDPDPFLPWDHERIAAVLRQIVPLDAEERAAIAARIEAALGSLELRLVRQELLESLGRHLMQQNATQSTPAAADSPWLVPPGGWPLEGMVEAERLVRAGVLRPLPVSRFLPRLRLELDLSRLATVSGTPPLTEMVYLPALGHCLDCVRELLTQVRRSLAPLLPSAPPPSAHLVVCGLKAAVRQVVPPPSVRAGKALLREITATIEDRLPASGSVAVMVTFR
jgi:hypothetical protein